MIVIQTSQLRLLLFFIVFIICACGNKDKKVVVSDSATSGAFELIADENLKPVIDSLVTGFNTQTPNAKVTVHYTSSIEALDELLSRKARLIIIGRPMTIIERKLLDSAHIDLPEFDIALSSIAVITSSLNASTMVSFDRLQHVATGKTETPYYSTTHLSTTETVFDSIFSLQGKFLLGNVKRFQTTDSVIASVRANISSIGFISSSWAHYLRSSVDTTIKTLPITTEKSDKPVMLHPAYIYQGLYPLTSRVCGYTFEVPNSIPRGFLAYVMSPEGQRVFLNYDVLPRTQIIKLVPLK